MNKVVYGFLLSLGRCSIALAGSSPLHISSCSPQGPFKPGFEGAECSRGVVAKKDNKIISSHAGAPVAVRADVPTFRAIGSHYFADKNSVFWCDERCRIISKNPSTFVVLLDSVFMMSDYGFDGKRYFYQGKGLAGVTQLRVLTSQTAVSSTKIYNGSRSKRVQSSLQCSSLGLASGSLSPQSFGRSFTPSRQTVSLTSTGVIDKETEFSFTGDQSEIAAYGSKTPLGFAVTQGKLPVTSYDSAGNYFVDFGDVMVIKPKKGRLEYSPLGKSAQSFSGSASLVINGTYFGWKDNKFIPAGSWVEEGVEKFNHHDPSDPNLQWNIVFHNNTFSLAPLSGSTVTGELIVNAGPVLFLQGKKQKEIDKKLSHRSSYAYRNILVKDATGDIYFVLVKEKKTLAQVTEFLEKSGMFYCGFEAINLDGGSSTSFRSSDFSFNPGKKVPIHYIVR